MFEDTLMLTQFALSQIQENKIKKSAQDIEGLKSCFPNLAQMRTVIIQGGMWYKRPLPTKKLWNRY